MTHYTVQFNSAIPEWAVWNKNVFRDWKLAWCRGMHQFEFCRQPVPCSAAAAI